MSADFYQQINQQLEKLKAVGLYKNERVITSAQKACISVRTSNEVLNFCSNNYLGLANNPTLIEAATKGMEDRGFGMASVRFICGTQDRHKLLEEKLAEFLGMEDAILYTSCFDANIGLFETIFDVEDAIISDAMNHASIIDGIRLCKSMRFLYSNNNMEDLEQQLTVAKGANARNMLIVTDGVFSMNGVIVNLPAICDLADKYGALVMIDDSHAVGVMGDNGRGTHEYHDVIDRIDIITGTLGKALGGSSGGYTSGKKEVIDWLRQRSRPYLFSNSLSPSIVSASLSVIDLLANTTVLRAKLWDNVNHFRARMSEAGFTLEGANHPIIPVILGDDKVSADFAERMLKEGIYVVNFSFPVVPKGQARIRIQMSAVHCREQLNSAIDAFINVGKDMGLIR
ncbi:glycine C-acetyltransferase [Candidatus Enterovibrio escicola]|uniref:2-amino-3-ketobutyrate coenzyme A ligase n=1 Tax=Candidatus Enterovibrio escicola TaxID=1927127 RepID=A0A2A5T4N0_9GAMM|nr:glycine C-acetyltransferase [Candidatus Enterovibrio escacola]PCS23106.1 2-amino-3-ketobutyrate coenzyme A ligase [Candidatus Enterovibrio escacola]